MLAVSGGSSRRNSNNRSREVLPSERSGSRRTEVQEIKWMPSAMHYQTLLTKVKDDKYQLSEFVELT
jgi:hypothetical protein